MAFERTRRISHALLDYAWRKLNARTRAPFLLALRLVRSAPDKLRIAPPDLRTCDPSLADQIYLGCYALSGVSADTGGRSPFEVDPPSEMWLKSLHEFGWLRHLRAAETKVARSNAQALIEDWIRLASRHPPIAYQPEVTAQRLLSWMSQSPMILAEVDHSYYKRFLRTLVRQVLNLSYAINEAPHGKPRLIAAIALATASVCLFDNPRQLRQRLARLDQELSWQILPDGGHVSRNPMVGLDLLVHLLPLRQALIAQGTTPSPTLIGAIDRMMPFLTGLRHGDGTFAHFNGVSTTPIDQVATILAFQEEPGAPPRTSPYGGYERLQAGSTLLILDTGAIPPVKTSADAHAGALSFELSSGRTPIVINCGAPQQHQENWRPFARATAAHSTLVFNETSSAQFLYGSRLEATLGGLILDGPTAVITKRTSSEEDEAETLTLSHDGYRKRFGLVHERRISVAKKGSQVLGVDRLIAEGKPPGADSDYFVLRFHLHPALKASVARGGALVHLILNNGEAWEFEVDTSRARLDESIHFAHRQGHRKTQQIVVEGSFHDTPEISWSFTRLGRQRSRNRRTVTAELPFEQDTDTAQGEK